MYPGNSPEEDDAFGHLAISTEDVYEASRKLEEEHNVTMKKRPNEGKSVPLPQLSVTTHTLF